MNESTIVLLLARGFDELFATQVVVQLRRQGLAITIVGNVSGPVNGEHGIIMLPDQTLSSFPAGDTPDLLVICDGDQCLSSLSADPRVHELIARVSGNGGQVVLPAGAKIWFSAPPSVFQDPPLLLTYMTTPYDADLMTDLTNDLRI